MITALADTVSLGNQDDSAAERAYLFPRPACLPALGSAGTSDRTGKGLLEMCRVSLLVYDVALCPPWHKGVLVTRTASSECQGPGHPALGSQERGSYTLPFCGKGGCAVMSGICTRPKSLVNDSPRVSHLLLWKGSRPLEREPATPD